ncbi:DUF4143 domain-containing protein [Candidatus Absconditicoccus praedator]|uniref:DUF4143 domain-containing protein n=1 Tax=Candidatus Absconditicoccus praedator TaxID=2735562 RepID=UPI001E3CAB79|nr:DUF4143 domain-containing protein [Candidatus Absconditicoccus praedator]UFX82734.1 DUF4143 domain-containing protein [Candidatus Absconditicoccus praedator]
MRLQKLSFNDFLGKFSISVGEAFEEYVVWGSIEKVYQHNGTADRKNYLSSIYQNYKNLLGIEFFDEILFFVGQKNGQRIKISDISSYLSVDGSYVQEVLDIMQNYGLLIILKPYGFEGDMKIYFLDNGILNFSINNFLGLEYRHDDGFLFEGFVISQFVMQGVKPENMYYWHDEYNKEIDLVVDDKNFMGAFEIKLKKKLEKKDISTIKNFSQQKNCQKAVIRPFDSGFFEGVRLLSSTSKQYILQ